MSDPKFEGSRESMKEFGGASRAAKSFKMCFVGVTDSVRKPDFNGRVTGLFYKICQQGIGERGKRTIAFGLHKEMIKGFEFSRTQTLGSVFFADYDPIVFNTNRDRLTWNVPGFNTDNRIHAPEGSTHFRLLLAAGILSDHNYNPVSGKYEPSRKEFNCIKGSIMSEPMALGGSLTAPISLSIDLGIGSALPTDVVVATAIGIHFFQEIDGVLYEMKGCHAMRIEAAF
jgi:hypothetical protein